MNRYYASGVGRFLTPDDYDGSENAMSPQSWSHYSYTQADPVNYRDRTGMLRAAVGEPCGAEWMWDASLAGPCDDDWDYDFYFLIGLAPIVRHSPSPPECSSGFVLAIGGTPMFNQDVTQARNRPPTNTLGCYARQSKFSDPNAGWYCAVQLWVTYSGGTGATSWNLLQWVDHQGWEETTQYPGVHQPINESHSDNQLDPSFVRVSRGIASLIDLPGEGMYTTNGRYQVVNADIFYTFHTSLNVGRYPGTPLCDIDWQVHVVVTNKVGHAEVSIQ